MEAINSPSFINDLFAINLTMVGMLFATYILLLSFVYTKIDERKLVVDEIRTGNASHLLEVKEDAITKSINRYNSNINKIIIQLFLSVVCAIVIFVIKNISVNLSPVFTVVLTLLMTALAGWLFKTIRAIQIEYKKKIK